MKRVGIITFHRANNFGAVLQCYALQETLKKLGYKVQVIDYREPYTELIYNPVRWDIMMQGLTRPRLLAGYLFKVFPERLKRSIQYNRFRKQYLNCTKPIFQREQIPLDFDTYLIGSDQMWSLHPTGYKIEPIYYGEFKISEDSTIQGYAISSNLKSLHTIGQKALSKYIKNFKRISFREKKIRDEVQLLTGVMGEVVLDPTLLLGLSDWDKLTTSNICREKYVLTYFLHEESSDLDFKNKVQEFAYVNNLKLIDIFDIAFSPVIFLNAIKYAECVLATSFHAVAFSILFHKTFYALRTNDGKDVRYINLLEELGLNRLTSTEDLRFLKLTPINYDDIDYKLNELRLSSIDFLKGL